MDKHTIIDQLQTNSIRAVAKNMGVSYTTIRYWIKFHKIELPQYHSTCPNCSVVFAQNRGNNPRRLCKECVGLFGDANDRDVTNAVQRSTLRRKAILVRKMGGKCSKCGYDRNTSALEFHHKNRKRKKFMINAKTLSNKSLAEIEKELKKCDLLCRNCHAETHHKQCSEWKKFPDFW